MTKAVAIVNVYPSDQSYDESPAADRREIVGVLLQAVDEDDTAFDKRVLTAKERLTNLTWREQYAKSERTPLPLSHMDQPVYSGYFEIETVDILE